MPDAKKDHFSSIAAAYAKGRFGYPAGLFDCLADLCADRALAWDCATGTGQAVTELARRFTRVVATDISAALLEHAPRLPNVTYAQAPAEHTALANASVDLVTVAQAIHWFDLNAFWREVRRVVKLGGILAYWAYTWPRVDGEVDRVFAAFQTQIAPYWPPGSELIHGEYRAIIPPFAPVPMPPFEINADWTRAAYLAHLGSWSAVRYFREQQGTDPLPVFERRLADVWPDEDSKAVHWPLHLHVYRV